MKAKQISAQRTNLGLIREQLRDGMMDLIFSHFISVKRQISTTTGWEKRFN